MQTLHLQDLSHLFHKPVNIIFNRLSNNKVQRGRKHKHSLIIQIVLTLFKLKYNLPDRMLELLFHIDHVTISRYVARISRMIAALEIKLSASLFYTVDTTTIRIGRDKSHNTFSGYKHHHGLKYQTIINDKKEIVSISPGIESSIHDKKIFELEYQNMFKQLNRKLTVLGDKAYVGLSKYHVKTPFKRNEQRFKTDKVKATGLNKALSSKRISIEHVFARLKSYRLLSMPYYYAKTKLDIFVKAIVNIYNLVKICT